MPHELIVTVTLAVLPVLGLVLTALGAWSVTMLAGHLADKRLAAAITMLAYGAAGIVADLAQNVVKERKDPLTPSTWTPEDAAATKAQAVGMLHRFYPGSVEIIAAALRGHGKVDDLLGTYVEKAVVDQKAAAPTLIVATDLPAALAPLDTDAARHARQHAVTPIPPSRILPIAPPAGPPVTAAELARDRAWSRAEDVDTAASKPANDPPESRR